MNRPLKFRVWNKSRNDWLSMQPSLHCFSEYCLDLEGGGLVRFDGELTDHEERYSRARQEDYYFKGTEIIKESPYVIQQFTGLLDKNNKEIFEGDIIKFENLEPWSVFFAGSCFCIYEPSALGISPLDAWELDKCEIIGNIFQNKELLTNE